MTRRRAILFRGEPAPEPVSTVRDLDRLETSDYNRLFYLWFQNVWVNEQNAPTEPQALASFKGSDLNEEFRRHVRAHGSSAWYRGGTVEEIWLGRQIQVSVPIMALLNSAQPECPIERITRRRRWPAHAIVSYLESVLEIDRYGPLVRWPGHGQSGPLKSFVLTYMKFGGCRALVYDGRNGYTIFPREFDQSTGGLIYTDPWPGDSVLCAGRNRAGARAIRHTRGNWLLSQNDLSRVLFAAFIADSAFAVLGDVEAWLDEMEARRDKRRPTKVASRRKR